MIIGHNDTLYTSNIVLKAIKEERNRGLNDLKTVYADIYIDGAKAASMFPLMAKEATLIEQIMDALS